MGNLLTVFHHRGYTKCHSVNLFYIVISCRAVLRSYELLGPKCSWQLPAFNLSTLFHIVQRVILIKSLKRPKRTNLLRNTHTWPFLNSHYSSSRNILGLPVQQPASVNWTLTAHNPAGIEITLISRAMCMHLDRILVDMRPVCILSGPFCKHYWSRMA